MQATSASTSTPAQRAAAEKLVAYPTAHPLVWQCSKYTIRITGPNPADVRCSCPDSVSRNRACKHAETVAFYRREGLRPIKPAVSEDHSKLPVAAQAAPSVPCRYCGAAEEIAELGMCVDCHFRECLDAEASTLEEDFVPASVAKDAIDPLHTYCAGCGSESFCGVTLCIICSAARREQFGVKEPQEMSINSPWMQGGKIIEVPNSPFRDLF